MADPIDPIKIIQGLLSNTHFAYKQNGTQRDKGYFQDSTRCWAESPGTKDVASDHVVKRWSKICCGVLTTRQMNR